VKVSELVEILDKEYGEILKLLHNIQGGLPGSWLKFGGEL
jgi:hypothetical protein